MTNEEERLEKILEKRLLTYYSGEQVLLATLPEKKKLYVEALQMFKQMNRRDLYNKMIN